MDQEYRMVTFSEQVYHILKEEIINQTLKCGDNLTIKALKERFNLSDVTIRQLLDRLNGDGLVEAVTDVGTEVVLFSRTEICEIYDIYSKLDIEALKLVFGGNNVDDFMSALEVNVMMQETAIRHNNINNFLMHSEYFHDLFYIYADNVELYNSFKNIRNRLSIFENIYQSTLDMKVIVLEEHRSISKAISTGQFDKAIKLLTDHIEHAKACILANFLEIEVRQV